VKNPKNFRVSLGFGRELNQVDTLNRYSVNAVSSFPKCDRNASENTCEKLFWIIKMWLLQFQINFAHIVVLQLNDSFKIVVLSQDDR